MEGFWGGFSFTIPPLIDPWPGIPGGPMGQLGGVAHTKGLSLGGPNHEPDPDPDGPTPGGGG